MSTNLPPGPWRYRPDKHDDWGCVRDAYGNPVANTCPPGLSQAFNELRPDKEARHSGPTQARAVAGLLIRAQREADTTPVGVEWLEAVGFVNKYGEYEIESPEISGEFNGLVFSRRASNLYISNRRGMHSSVIGTAISNPTRGQVRTLCRVLGIGLKEAC